MLVKYFFLFFFLQLKGLLWNITESVLNTATKWFVELSDL